MVCPHIPELTYAEFGEALVGRIRDKRIPITGTMELTERCNLDCAHCFVNLPPDDRQVRTRELSTEQVCDLLDQIADAGCLSLVLTGGEPLVRSDFLEIYDYAKRKGFLITLFTNGSLMTPEIADHLHEWPPFLVEVTLYGMSQETYERVTRVPGSYERCMRGIQLLSERDIPLGLKMVLMTLNRHEFEAVREYARELTGDFRYDAMLKPRPDGTKDVLSVRLTPAEVVELDLADERAEASFVRMAKQLWEHGHNDDHLYICGAGLHSFHIDAYGQLSPCILSRYLRYDLLAGIFQEGWRDFLAGVRAQTVSQEFKCRTCDWRAICGSCPAFAQLENGDPETAVDFACRVGHLRAEAFGLDRRVLGRSAIRRD